MMSSVACRCLERFACQSGVWQESESLAAGQALAFAVGQEFADEKTAIKDNDEVAIFPPVTGG